MLQTKFGFGGTAFITGVTMLAFMAGFLTLGLGVGVAIGIGFGFFLNYSRKQLWTAVTFAATVTVIVLTYGIEPQLQKLEIVLLSGGSLLLFWPSFHFARRYALARNVVDFPSRRNSRDSEDWR